MFGYLASARASPKHGTKASKVRTQVLIRIVLLFLLLSSSPGTRSVSEALSLHQIQRVHIDHASTLDVERIQLECSAPLLKAKHP